jgi:serine/threonine protein phosphatase 1
MFAALKRVFQAFEPQPAAPPATAPGLAYAVGDVHGRADLLETLLADLEADREAAAAAEPARLVFLGDLIDRGPDARAVIDQVLALKGDARWRVVALKGNHEDALLHFLDDPRFGPAWMQYGGAATLAAYGVTPPRGSVETEWIAARNAFRAALGPDHLAFFRSLPLTFEWGDYLFVHAGVRPGVPLDEQSEHDLLWIREAFLLSERATDKVVVHGHTPALAPHLSRWRIGVDTGACFTGVLTALRVDGISQAVLQTADAS